MLLVTLLKQFEKMSHSFFSVKPAAFFCDFCETECSGIWQHLKCRTCVDVYACSACTVTASNTHPHQMWTVGEEYNGIICNN